MQMRSANNKKSGFGCESSFKESTSYGRTYLQQFNYLKKEAIK